MNDPAALNATARIRQLIDLTERLTARLEAEYQAFEARRPHDALSTLHETQDLANAYRRDSAQVKATPSILAAAPASARLSLIRATEAFDAVLSRHALAVDAARTISEGLVRTIAAEVTSQRGNPSAYGSAGHASVADGRAVAYNRTA